MILCEPLGRSEECDAPPQMTGLIASSSRSFAWVITVIRAGVSAIFESGTDLKCLVPSLLLWYGAATRQMLWTL